MDQDAFRQTYRELNERYCVYEKAILSRKCQCDQAKKLCIAEREAVHCTSDEAQQLCLSFLEQLRQHARFALKSNNEHAALPHGKAMRLQVGGLRGIFLLLHPEQPLPETIENVHQLISLARKQFERLEQLPYHTLIQQVAAYQGRQRNRGTR